MRRQRILGVISILLAAIGLLIPAIYNGFPLVYSDTGAYIASGFQGDVPGDRPISYGLFLRHSSLATSLWFTVFTQGLLLSIFAYRVFCKIWSEPMSRWWAFLLAMILLILCSGVSYFTSMVMADISGSLSLFLLYFLLFDTPRKKWQIVLLLIGYLFFASMHFTNVYGHLMALFGLAVLKLLNANFLALITWRKWVFGSAMVLLNFLFVPALHYYYDGGFVSSKNGHLFITARLIESGAMKVLLDDNCATENYALCAYKDSLPRVGSDFLWLPESILYKLGGWTEHRDEYKSLNRRIFFERKYFLLFFDYYVKVSWHHLGEHNIGEELIPMNRDSPPGMEISEKFREELPQFLNAKQAKNYWEGKFNYINEWIFWIFILAILIIVIALVFGVDNFYLKGFIYLSLFMYIGNFFAVSIASSGSRYNARLDWLLVLVAMLILFSKVGRLKRFAN